MRPTRRRNSPRPRRTQPRGRRPRPRSPTRRRRPRSRPSEPGREAFARALMKVFISHSSKNKDDAVRLRDDLVGEKIKTWLDRDELRGGDPLIDELQEALASS